MSDNETYKPHSFDAMMSRVMEKLNHQDDDLKGHMAAVKAELAYIRASVDKTNGRVTRLEYEKWMQRGFVTALSMGATAIWHWLTQR
jgi:hypothetical protein